MSNKSNLLKVSLMNGLITGVIFIVITALAYLLDIGMMWWIAVMVITIIIIVIAMIKTIKKVRESVDDKTLNYGMRVLTGVIVAVVAGWVSGAFSYLLFNVIDPDHMMRLAEDFGETLMGFGVPEEEAYKSVDDMKEGFKPMEQIKSNFLNMPAFYIVVSLIVSAFIKSKKPDGTAVN